MHRSLWRAPDSPYRQLDPTSKPVAMGESAGTLLCGSQAVMLPSCMQIMAVWWRGDQLHGLIRLLDTASGRRAAQLLLAGQHLGASSRSWTSLVPDANSGTDIVQDDMHLITCVSLRFLLPM